MNFNMSQKEGYPSVRSVYLMASFGMSVAVRRQILTLLQYYTSNFNVFCISMSKVRMPGPDSHSYASLIKRKLETVSLSCWLLRGWHVSNQRQSINLRNPLYTGNEINN